MKDSASRARGQRRGSRLRRDGCIVAVFLCLATFAAACGGSHGAAGGAPRSPLAFATCMRAHGLPNFPDPDSNGQFNLAGINQNSPQARRAFQACGSSGANTDPGQRSQWMAQGLKFSRCMRAHGVPNFPDPNSNGQNSVQVNGQNPLFQQALKACRPLLSGGSSSGSTP
jgi:hypothetical protein